MGEGRSDFARGCDFSHSGIYAELHSVWGAVGIQGVLVAQ